MSKEIFNAASVNFRWEGIISPYCFKKKEKRDNTTSTIRTSLISLAQDLILIWKANVKYTNIIQQIEQFTSILPLSYTDTQVHSKILINSNQLAGRGSVIIPISTTAGAKP